jgi:hypothetical protein
LYQNLIIDPDHFFLCGKEAHLEAPYLNWKEHIAHPGAMVAVQEEDEF